tara:strand:- start:216 stop:389 length:174 start_codon:yes stop_codon:yes gene_type:complete
MVNRKRISEVKDRMDEIWEQYDYNGSVEDLSEFEQLVIELYELENTKLHNLYNKIKK